MPSKTSYGKSECKNAVWNKMPTIKGKSPDIYRKDAYNNILTYNSYGKDTKTGWNIDHIKPKSKGGSDNIRNLQALQTFKNKSLGNTTSKKSINR